MADDDGLNFDFEEQLDVQPEVPTEEVSHSCSNYMCICVPNYPCCTVAAATRLAGTVLLLLMLKLLLMLMLLLCMVLLLVSVDVSPAHHMSSVALLLSAFVLVQQRPRDMCSVQVSQRRQVSAHSTHAPMHLRCRNRRFPQHSALRAQPHAARMSAMLGTAAFVLAPCFAGAYAFSSAAHQASALPLQSRVQMICCQQHRRTLLKRSPMLLDVLLLCAGLAAGHCQY
jgi:hypothetical protein